MKGLLKHRFLATCIWAAMSVLVWGCETGEQFVTKEAGLWNVVSRTEKIYENEELLVDETTTDSLGQMEFLMTGQGFKIEPSRRDTFVWQLGAEDERLIVYYKIGPWMNAEISNRTPNGMTLDWSTESDQPNRHIVWEYTMKIERAR